MKPYTAGSAILNLTSKPTMKRPDEMIVWPSLPEMNAACSVKFAKQMSLVYDASNAIDVGNPRFSLRLRGEEEEEEEEEEEKRRKEETTLSLSLPTTCVPTRGSRIQPTVSGCTVMAIMMMVIEALWVFRKTDAGAMCGNG